MALACPKTIQQWPLTSVKIKTGKSDCGVCHQSGIDHHSRLPVFPPLTCDINCLQVPPQWFARFQAKWKRVKDVIIYGNGQSRWHSACVINLSVAALHRRAGGSIFVRMGNHGNGVDRTVPEMRRMEECSWASTRLTYGTLPHWATVFCHRVTQSQRRWSQGISVSTPRGSSKFHQKIILAL